MQRGTRLLRYVRGACRNTSSGLFRTQKMYSQISEQGDVRGKADQSHNVPLKKENFHVRLMSSPAELSLLFEWAAAEGWQPGVYDAESFFRQDPTGFYLAELGGVPIAGLGAVKYGEDLVGMGLYIVKPPFRGKGYGYAMCKEVMEKLGDKNKFSEAVAAQKNNYETTWGFVGSWKTTRYRGVRRDAVPGSRYAENAAAALVSVDQVNFEDLLTFDQKVFGGPRPAFLKSWIQQPGMVSYVAIESVPNVDDTDQNRECKIVGYGCIRLSYESYKDTNFSRKIGPIFAESPTVGSLLFKALVATVPLGVPYYMDVIEANKNAMQIVREFGLEGVLQTTRMYTKNNCGVEANLMYGKTTLEIG